MAELVVYPDAHPETTSVDGCVGQIEATLSWADLRIAAGNTIQDSTLGTELTFILSSATADCWERLWRSVFLFDTSALGASASISSAILSLYGYEKANRLGLSETDFKINVYTSAPASNTALADGDFDSLGSSPLCDTPITYAAFSVPGYNDFTLNAAGLAAIAKTGITKLGIREVTFDVDGGTPTWTSYLSSHMRAWSADKGGGRPQLTITYTPAFIPWVAIID